jgi:hypothetical protein
MVEAVITYVARRLIERERALAEDAKPILRAAPVDLRTISHAAHRRRIWSAFLFGMLTGALAFAAGLWIVASRLHG